MNRPPHITEKFRHELTVESGIKPELAKLNTKFIVGDDVYASLLYALPHTARRNDGRLRDHYLRRYEAIANNGGLWFYGLDPIFNWEQPMEWGRLKPVTPRIHKEDGKSVKYESPVKTPNRLLYFRVDLKTWELVAKRYNVPMPERVVVTEEGEALGFWSWVQSHPQFEPILTEGEKKALCLLSLGFVAIALPGIWGGRVGKKELEQVHPDLVPLAQKGRKFIILFDYEIIQNNWKSGGRDVYWYEGANSSSLVAKIHASVLTGQKAIVVSDSKRFIKKLERSFLLLDDALSEEDSPEAEADRQVRVWAIHSENSGSEENKVFIEEINTAVKTIDVLMTSPSLGTGVDISDYHFNIIFGAFHAVSQSATECAQQLWRYRPNVDMHVWVAPRPPFGYAETNSRKIKESYLQKNELTAFLIRLDRETGRRGAEKEWALDTCCQIEAQRNWSINNLRLDLRSLLAERAHKLAPHLKPILGLTIREDATPMWILGKFLEQLGLATTAQRGGSKGRVRQYTLSTEKLEFAQQVLSYRQQRRDKKERKHQLERELMERRAAGMATQYGIQTEPPAASTSPPFISGNHFRGDVDTKQEPAQILSEDGEREEEILDKSWWDRVKKYTQLVIDRLGAGVQAVKDVMANLSLDQRWGVILEMDEASPECFEQFMLIMPDWVDFCDAVG